MVPMTLLLLLSAGFVGSIFLASEDDPEASDLGLSDNDEQSDADFTNGDMLDDVETSANIESEQPRNVEVVSADDGAGQSDESAQPESKPDDLAQGQEIFGTDSDDIIELKYGANDGGNTIFGGDGRDFIRSSALASYDGSSATNLFTTHLGSGDNTIFGGDGDDIIEVSHGDVVDVGSGRDTVLVMADISPSEASFEAVLIRDLQPDDDKVVVNIPVDPTMVDNPHLDTPLHLRVASEVDGSDTLISVDGIPTVRIMGQADVEVGVQNDPNLPFSVSDLGSIKDSGHLALSGLNGSSLSGALPTVIVRYYTDTLS